MVGGKIRVLLFFVPLVLPSFSHSKAVNIDFYSNTVHLTVRDGDLNLPKRIKLNEKGIRDFYGRLKKDDWESISDQLFDIKDKYKLNDWFYYKLLVKAVEGICPGADLNYRNFLVGLILFESGYNIKLNLGKYIEIYVFTEDKVFSSTNFGRYYNLTSLLYSDLKKAKYLNFSTIFKNIKGKSFDFSITRMPELPANKFVERKLEFQHDGQKYNYSLEINESYVELMQDYPEIETKEYFFIPLSDTAYNTLLPKISRDIVNKNQAEKVRFILSLVGKSYLHADDMEIFGKSKPMIPEEALYYQYSDCEDRSALFSYLIKEIIDVPIIILDYPNHVNVGLALDEINDEKLTVEYKNIKFIVCEPSGPFEKATLGESPQAKGFKPRIVGEYFPSKTTGITK